MLNPSLLNLKYLSYLDMSGNNFQGIPIPEFIGSLKNLRYLDLSEASFNGEVPHSLGNLSYLEYLDLSMYGSYPLQLWASAMNLSRANNWFEAVNMLLSLTTLYLSSCELNGLPESLTVNFTLLSTLDLSYNNFNTWIPRWLFNITTLQRVNFYECGLKGSIREGFIDALGGCSNNTLADLDLSSDNLQGNLPDSLGKLKYLRFTSMWSIGNLSSLTILDLSFNSMNATVLQNIGQLTRIITENHFWNLSRLYRFALSSISKSVIFNLSRDWVPSYSLSEITVSNCQLGPGFPTWLRTQVELSQLTLSVAGISDMIPVWFWNLTSSLWWVDLSDNQFRGKLPGSVSFGYNIGAWHLSLGNNLFCGPVPSNIGQRMSKVINLDLSRNFLNGSIPASINQMETLSFLNLSSNCLSRTILRKLQGLRKLVILDLSKNNLLGDVTSSLCALPSLIFLKLSCNNLSGELFSVLKNCSGLLSIDLGENRFSGTIPDLCEFHNLHIIGLAQNNLSGTIPKCLGHLEAFTYLGPYSYELPSTQHIRFLQHVEIVSKGNVIDLSSNDLKGDIPDHITELSALVTLNLSWNHLSGNIPENIGNLQRLESSIPDSMISMTLLNHLNLSFNKLSRQIPTGNRFQTFNDPSIYQENPELCGPPL
ncbi:hypothetical protein E1A91_D02G178100v1 [Gossypium mustelinum]|uniref:Leucine-rich repeat-containing N-terminal plant-type domain-containing protein n=1 Tax=Gossypium mustelinum TaxID=34275 RepID=A0A5D2VX32_GOSMU|nr:hypothetical protein E1A91_D02G178100v1 [Gossypium mustelinum]